ncbi:MAG: endonuclease domain-containing protein [Pseudomonadota bacterium]|nr:endonuclease domain-containing protein [Pseudomonadota bacterium]
MSLPEVLLWQVLRGRPHGLKFRRQFPIGEIIVDFACLERRLEIDGEGHSYGDQPRRDAARDAVLKRRGFRVMRIAARDVLDNLDGALQWVVATCGEGGAPPGRFASWSPSPFRGGLIARGP